MTLLRFRPHPIPERTARGFWTFLCLLIVGLAPSETAIAQSSLRSINADTKVARVRFRGNNTLSDGRLKEVIATVGPSRLDRLTFWRKESHPFDPVELQKDLTRLRRLYARHGFPSPRLDYIAQLDADANAVRILFTIDEGPAIVAQSVDFYGPDGKNAAYQFRKGAERARWSALRRRLTYLRTGDRLTSYGLSRIQDHIIESLSNAGYAFPQVTAETRVDSISRFADVRIVVDSGPIATVDSILVIGNSSVPADIVRRGLSVRPGDIYEHRLLARSQRALFALDLFRLALVDLADNQTRDSTVSISVSVEEAAHRYVRAQTGYARDDGLSIEGAWTHRNFLGGARKLSLQATWLTGIAAVRVDDIGTGNRQRISLSLHQPHIGTYRLSGILSPYFERRQDTATDALEAGLITNLVYQLHPFRPLSFRHTFARATPILGTRERIGSDFYNKSLVELTAILGSVDNYVRPRRGFLVQPFIEYSGGLLRSDVEYLKIGGDLTAYRSVGSFNLSARLFGGLLRTYGASADPGDPVAAERLDPVRFYAGGSRDVRGWSNRGLGPKSVRKSGDTVDGVQQYEYEPDGGTRKLAGSIDLAIPVLRSSENLMAGIFLDFGQLAPQGTALTLDPEAFRFGSGIGLRVSTPAGMIRVDLATKLNPSVQDLRSANDFAAEGENAPVKAGRRFRLHVSLGRDH